ncbi:hypothetical protein K3163_13270 [Qipengyuania sp. 1NDW9]|uniref:hypothetical protein n=1 Tax=Qipengyuania xiapuensis TaxID=2867236 RepID=UPI001C86B71F|nr:hypothetical protein [Qipengyuania xiapuensis]MBX7494180.1 hypothetical protein [Qipengyuania xiapuensis]
MLAAHLALHGNAYVQIVKDAAGVPVELYPLRPERVQVVAGDDGWPSYSAPLDPDGGSTIDVEARTAISELITLLKAFGIFS